MEKKSRWSKIGLRSKIFMFFTMFVIIPFILFTFLYYNIYQNYAKETYGKYSLQSISAVQEQIDRRSQELVNGTMMFYFNGVVNQVAQTPIDNHSIDEIQSNLSSMMNSFSSISSMYLVNNHINIQTGVNYREFLEIVKPYEESIVQNGGRHTWLPVQYLLPKSNSGYKLIMGKSLNTSNKKNLAILYLVIDIEHIASAFDNMYDEAGVQFLIDKEGGIMYSSETDRISEKIDKNLFLEGRKKAYYIKEFENEKSLIIYDISYQTGWISAVIIPFREILKGYDTIRFLHLIISLIYIVFLVLMLYEIERHVFKPIRALIDVTDSFASGNMTASVKIYDMGELGQLNSHFNKMTKQIDYLIKKNEKEIKEKNNFKMQALMSQLNPHFVYNTLNTIKWLAVINKQDNIRNVIEALTHTLMTAARVDDEHYSLQDELHLIQNYAVIQKVRFMNFDIIFEVDEEAKNCKIRKFLIQPVIENSIIHGFSKGKKRSGEIHIKAYCDDKLHIIVKDNGNGFDVLKWRYKSHQSNINHTNIALHNIEQIIKLEYGEEHKLIIESEIGKGTAVEYLLPIKKEGEFNDSGNNS